MENKSEDLLSNLPYPKAGNRLKLHKMKKGTLTLIRRIVLLSFLSCMAAMHGEETPDSAVALRSVEVTGKRTVPATVQTISGASLRELASTSVADAIKYFAGVQIKDFGGIGGLKTANVRSLGAQHVGVFIDGIRITNAQNGTVDLGKYSLSTLESVSLYNANKLDKCQSASEYASGATIYLRTRRPESDSLSVLAGIGSFHTYRGRVNAQFCRKGWCGFADVEYLNSRGDYPFRYHSEYEDTVGRRTNSDIRYVRAEAALFKGGFASHLYLYKSQRGVPGGIVRRLSDKFINVGREWDTDMFAQGSYTKSFGHRHLLKFNLKYSHEYLRYNTDYPENQNTVRADNHYYENDAYASAAYTFFLSDKISGNVSYDARMTWLEADVKRFSTVRRLDQKAVAAVQGEWRGFRAAASVLYQHYRDHTHARGAADPLSRFTPAVSLGYSYGGLTLRAWYKSIFRAPTLNDLYYTRIGNRMLKPEYTRQWNIGAEYRLTGLNWLVTAQADGYINHITDRIVCLPIKGTYSWSMMNYGRTYCRGLNATLNGRYFHNSWNFSLMSAITWQKDLNRTDRDDANTYNKPICYSPAFSCSLTGMAGWRDYSVTVSYLHTGKRSWSYGDPGDVLPPYNNVDLRLSGRWRFLAASLEIIDLFDCQYEHLPRYPMPGRNFKFTITYTL